MKPAELGVPRAFDVHSQLLDNGLKVLLVENPSLPTVSLNASVMTGSRHDPEAKAGLALMASRHLAGDCRSDRIGWRRHRLGWLV